MVVLVTVLVLIYIGRKVIRPFDKMTGLTEELAKGNLSTPIKQEKSRFFGRFIWGMDMLRENLEDSKAKNLEYQKEKKTLLMSLSHDIKTPLSAIQLYTKALSENVYETEEERTKALEGIRAKTDEIRGYVDKIYSLSREEFMEFDVHAGEAYLKDVMDGITAYYMDKLSVIHTEFVVDDYDNILLSCDKDRLVEAIQNLMENAIKYGDGKLIRISFADEEDCRLITVENSGCSLEEAELNNIFDSVFLKRKGFSRNRVTRLNHSDFSSCTKQIFHTCRIVHSSIRSFSNSWQRICRIYNNICVNLRNVISLDSEWHNASWDL